MDEPAREQYGNVLFMFCGGGCKAVGQAYAAAEVVKAGFHPTHIISSSAGSCNALAFVESPGVAGAEKALRIWEHDITSPDAIYEIHPFLRHKLMSLLGAVPQATKGWGRSGSLLRDLHRALRFFPLIFSLGVGMPIRLAGRSVSFLFRLMDEFASPLKSFRRLVHAPEIQQTIDEFDRYFEVKRMRAFLDPFPLLTTLAERINLQKVIESPVRWSVLAERYEDGATVVFSNKDADLASLPGEDARIVKTKHDLFYKRIRASMALYPLFEMVEIDGYRYLDADLANPLPVELALQSGCQTVFIFLNVPRQSVRLDPSPLRDLMELNVLTRINERYIHQRLREAQFRAKEFGVNLFVIRPEAIPAGLGLLEIDRKVIEQVRGYEQRRMQDYLASLDAQNLRFAPPIS